MNIMLREIKKIAGLTLFGVCLWANFAGAEPQIKDSPTLPRDVFAWVQSTSRADYYYNHEQMYFKVDDDGYIDLNVFTAPTVKIYDEVQKRDIRTKREWKSLPLEGYDRLTGGADYLRFDLTADTVTVYAHEDLDETWTALDRTESDVTKKMADFSSRDVDGIFYRSIMQYADKHKDELIEHSIKVKNGKLKDEDNKRLEKEKKLLEKEKKQREKEARRQAAAKQQTDDED